MHRRDWHDLRNSNALGEERIKIANPIRRRIGRFFYKVFRIFYGSWNFYFMPYTVVFLPYFLASFKNLKNEVPVV